MLSYQKSQTMKIKRFEVSTSILEEIIRRIDMDKILFKTVVKTNVAQRWYLEIIDTSGENKNEICLDLDEYAQKIEVMGAVHGGEIEVTWSAEKDVTPGQMNEVRNAMMAFEQKLEEEKQQAENSPTNFNESSKT